MRVSKVLKNSFLLSAITYLGVSTFDQAADAASVTNRWNVTTAESDGYAGTGGHALWFDKMGKGDSDENGNIIEGAQWLPSVKTKRFVFQDTGLFEEFDDGTARLTGKVVDKYDRNPDTENFWDVDIWFDQTFVRAEGAQSKNELDDAGKSIVNTLYGIGDSDPLPWRHYGIRETDDSGNPLSVLTGKGIYEDFELRIMDGLGANDGHEVQVGYGANGKNIEMGMSSWFSYDVFSTAGNPSGQWIARQTVADVNVDLIAVPEPTSLMGLGLVGLGLYARRKSQNTEDV